MGCCCNKDIDLVSGDDSNAFGQNLLRITLKDKDHLLDNHSISKAELNVNGVTKVFNNPVFPLIINLTSAESEKLACGENMAFLAIWDEEGKKVTPEGGQIINIGARKV